MTVPSAKRDPWSRVIRPSAVFAFPFALISFLRVVIGVVRGSAPVPYLVTVPLLAFGLFVVLALTLQVTGVVREGAGNQLDVSLWFVWLVSGALALFFVGALIRAQDVAAEDS